MRLKIFTPEQVVVDEEVTSVTLPGSVGQMTILPQHASFVSTLKQGPIYYKAGERVVSGHSVDGGVVEVHKNTVLVITKAWQTSEANPSRH